MDGADCVEAVDDEEDPDAPDVDGAVWLETPADGADTMDGGCWIGVLVGGGGILSSGGPVGVPVALVAAAWP